MPASLYLANALGPAFHAFAITPDPVNPLPAPTKAIYVGTTGDITLRCRDSTADVVLKTVPAGSVLHLNVAYVRAAGTTASNMVGFA